MRWYNTIKWVNIKRTKVFLVLKVWPHNLLSSNNFKNMSNNLNLLKNDNYTHIRY